MLDTVIEKWHHLCSSWGGCGAWTSVCIHVVQLAFIRYTVTISFFFNLSYITFLEYQGFLERSGRPLLLAERQVLRLSYRIAVHS